MYFILSMPQGSKYPLIRTIIGSFLLSSTMVGLVRVVACIQHFIRLNYQECKRTKFMGRATLVRVIRIEGQAFSSAIAVSVDHDDSEDEDPQPSFGFRDSRIQQGFALGVWDSVEVATGKCEIR